MNNERLMLKGIFLGAAAGAALSLLHKPTRQACGMRWLTCKHKLSLYKSNPELLKTLSSQKWMRPKSSPERFQRKSTL